MFCAINLFENNDTYEIRYTNEHSEIKSIQVVKNSLPVCDIYICVLMTIKKVVGVAMVVLVSIWTGHCMGGFSGSDDANLVFNWHPLLMVISLIFLYGNGILVYRVAR